MQGQRKRIYFEYFSSLDINKLDKFLPKKIDFIYMNSYLNHIFHHQNYFEFIDFISYRSKYIALIINKKYLNDLDVYLPNYKPKKVINQDSTSYIIIREQRCYKIIEYLVNLNLNFQLSNHINIEGRLIGKGYPCFIIAEAGVSHFGDIQKAFKLVDLAVDAGADAVKFQIFDVDFLISDDLPEWKERLQPRQLPYRDFEKIKEYCLSKKILFFATAHDRPFF